MSRIRKKVRKSALPKTYRSKGMIVVTARHRGGMEEAPKLYGLRYTKRLRWRARDSLSRTMLYACEGAAKDGAVPALIR